MKFKIKGVDFEITFLFVALITFIITMNVPANVLITIFSSLFHEMGHLLTMLAVGNKPQSVRFEITGMNIQRMQSIKISTKNELLIALGGPLVNGIIFVICCFAICFYKSEILLTVACVNLILMTFNLLPVKRLDGGMALYFFLSRRFDSEICAKMLKITSIIFIVFIYLWGLYVFISSGYNFSVLIIAIFLTLSMFGSNEY